MNINWTALAGHSANDYLALFPTGTYSRVWLQCTGTALSGSISVPLNVPAGSYDIRYYLDNSGTVIAQTTITVVAPSANSQIYSVSATGPVGFRRPCEHQLDGAWQAIPPMTTWRYFRRARTTASGCSIRVPPSAAVFLCRSTFRPDHMTSGITSTTAVR